MFPIEIGSSLFELLVRLTTLSQHALAQDRLMVQWFQIFNWLLLFNITYCKSPYQYNSLKKLDAFEQLYLKKYNLKIFYRCFSNIIL